MNSAPGRWTRARAWAWYAVVWIPTAGFYAVPMARTRPMTAVQALMQGFTHVRPAAILGIGVWHLPRLVEWPPRSKWRFAAIHLVGAAMFSGIWLGIEVGTIAIATGIPVAIDVSKIFAGFQAIDGVFMYA